MQVTGPHLQDGRHGCSEPLPVRERHRRRPAPAAASKLSGYLTGAGMSDPQSHARYEIRLEGTLDQHWTAWFEGLQVTTEGSQTVISGPLPDQPALHGVLIKVRDLGLCLDLGASGGPRRRRGGEPAMRRRLSS